MIRSHNKTIYEALGREPVHPFPARMAPGIALDILNRSKRPLKVLDPMMGSGTVIAMARASGHRAVGIDIDPLAVLISRAWTVACDKDRVRASAQDVLERARNVFEAMPVRDAYPAHATDETKKFVTYWFDGYARRQLASLAKSIGRVHDEATQTVLWCAFSRLIIAKQAGASLAMDLAHSRPHKAYDYAPAKPFQRFLPTIERVVQNCLDRGDRARGPAPSVSLGDARNLSLSKNSIDLVLTSPPYLNAIDYIRCSKFSLIWMGHSVADLRSVRSDSVGAEVSMAPQDEPYIRDVMDELSLRPRLNARGEAVLARYVADMRQSVDEVSRVLVPGGQAIYVIGENTVRGTYIRNSRIISALAKRAGLKLFDRRTRALPQNRRYMPPPTSQNSSTAMGERMRREVLLAFEKR